MRESGRALYAAKQSRVYRVDIVVQYALDLERALQTGSDADTDRGRCRCADVTFDGDVLLLSRGERCCSSHRGGSEQGDESDAHGHQS